MTVAFQDPTVAGMFAQLSEAAARMTRAPQARAAQRRSRAGAVDQSGIDWECVNTCSQELQECMSWARGPWDQCWCRNFALACSGSCGLRHQPFEYCVPDA